MDNSDKREHTPKAADGQNLDLTRKGSGIPPITVTGLTPGAELFEAEREEEPDWNSKLEIAAKEIGEVSSGYKLMHISVAQRASRTYMIVMFLGIIMGPVTGVLSGIGAALDNSPTPPLIPIMVTIMS